VVLPVGAALLLGACGPFGPSPADHAAPVSADQPAPPASTAPSTPTTPGTTPATTPPTTPPTTPATTPPPPPPQGVIAGSKVGIDEAYNPLWESTANLNADLDAIKASGAAWVSWDFDWSAVQDGGPNSYNWALLDRGVAAANARGLQILAIPDYTPSWARPAGTDNKYPPTRNADYVAFVQAAVARYAPQGVHHWAIWNEPNNPSFWKPNPDVAAYATLLKATYPAIKTLDPTATVLTGGTAPSGDPLSPADWLAGLYANGAQGSFDAVNHHPYAGLPSAPATIAPWNSFQQTLDLHNLMVSHGDGNKHVWGTEAGAYTGTATGAVDAATQAQFITQYLQIWNSWTFTGPLFIYELRDAGTDPTNSEDNWGLQTPNHTPKPAWAAFTSAIHPG
jgi:hypothetical protein